MAGLIVFGIFVVLIVIGTPIGLSLATAAIGAILNFDLGIAMISRNFEANISKFPLVAIPFFILAGVGYRRTRDRRSHNLHFLGCNIGFRPRHRRSPGLGFHSYHDQAGLQ
ncbi:MAG: C4-dicarboxylate transporter DctM subunit [Spirochaetes bacterium]|nr:MAG: C4-dicarboxylate transporter DctM subunit [Spirochaetota bacterium]